MRPINLGPMAKQNSDLVAEFPGLLVIHQKIPAREVGRHEHAEHEFFMPLQGEITITPAGGQSLKAGPGRMLYVPPDLDHSFSSTAQGSGERVIWLIDDRLWKKHAHAQFASTVMPTNTLAKELLFYLLIHQKAEGAKYFVSALVQSLLESLESAASGARNVHTDHVEGRSNDKRVKRAIEILNENLADVSITEIAEQSGLSARNFNRLFLHETGLTPKSYLIARRIERAKEMLVKTRQTVTDISLEVGYSSLSKFIETFKRMEGQLPSDYREQNRGR